ncbi:scavenger receptor cysteine-rich domain-containing protein DMBT1-like [Diadema antillarum]|uniref:scavenger receptor cysteine-rich domain-containing protein DMBT1-like n=1 Tax=Diadema antillarum TaxID=105358 RepID=UPI003A8BFA7D
MTCIATARRRIWLTAHIVQLGRRIVGMVKKQVYFVQLQTVSHLRLVHGRSVREGRVEILYQEDEWGTVCDNSWSLEDANVVCRMLGYQEAWAAPCCATFGHASGRILLDSVECDGTENHLAECRHGGQEVEVRLADGTNEMEGRVEVLHNGEWSTVCDDSWGMDDANVVCRMLGFGGAAEASCCAHVTLARALEISCWTTCYAREVKTIMLGFLEAAAAPLEARYGPGSGSIILDDVSCDGQEENLADCEHRGFKSHKCVHEEDASVVCSTLDEGFQIRLVDGSNEYEGRVEVRHEGVWGTVCDDYWSIEDATVVCKMLGSEKALEAPCCARFGHVNLMSALSGAGTRGKTPRLDIRLVNGSSDNEGRVEVLFEGRWGTVCDDNWDIRDANIICRMLGYVGALEASCCAKFGRGSGYFLLDDVTCTGEERNVAQCLHAPFETHDCNPYETAGVVCTLC